MREGGGKGEKEGGREGGVSLMHEPSSGRKRTEDEWKEKFRGGGVMKLRFMSSLKGEFTQNFFSPTMSMDSLVTILNSMGHHREFHSVLTQRTPMVAVCSSVKLVR